MRLGFKIAARFLKSSKGQTILIVLGIAIGVSVQIFIGSLIQGLQKGLIETTIGNSPQITVTSGTEDILIEDYGKIKGLIKDTDPAVTVVSEVLDNPAFFESGGVSQSMLIRGFDIESADGIYNLIERIEEGTYPRTEDHILIGIDLKDEYSLELYDTVSISTYDRNTVEMTVVGFFDLQVASINNGWGIVTIKRARDIFDSGETVTSIEVKLDDDSVFLADEIADKMGFRLMKYEVDVTNWKAQNESLLSGLQGQDISSLMIQIFVMVSVVLAIASVLAITVIQKSRQIGILKAMGLRNSSTSYVFLFEGLILGIFGAIFGILFGLGLSVAFTKFAVNPDGTPVIDLYINYSFIALSGGIAVTASMLAALLPAIRSSKLNPIDIIRDN